MAVKKKTVKNPKDNNGLMTGVDNLKNVATYLSTDWFVQSAKKYWLSGKVAPIRKLQY